MRKEWTQKERKFLFNNHNKLSVMEIAKKLNRSYHSIKHKLFRLNLNFKHIKLGIKKGDKLPKEWIENIRKAKLGDKNPMWKGDDAGYEALHYWVNARKPKPEFCVRCNKNKPYDLANISGKYLRDVNDYEWLCRRCHMKEDGRLKKFMTTCRGIINRNKTVE